MDEGVLLFRLLGPLEITVGGQPRGLGPRQSLVLVMLLLHANQVVSPERLLEAVWERPTKSWPSNIRTHAAAIRRLIGPGRLAQARSGRGYLLTLRSGELDAEVFERTMARGMAALRAGKAELAADWLALALCQWRGRALEGLSPGPALRLECANLEAQRMEAAERYVEARLAIGDLVGLPERLRQWLHEQPYRESMWAQLMLTLYRSGRAAEALTCYSQMRHLLRDGMGLDPSLRLRDLRKRILTHDPTLA